MIDRSNRLGLVIFWVVHAILALGVAIAALEFFHARQTRRAKPETNEIKISMEGIALKTSLHGILILGLAFGFYFLYLKFVYTIQVVG